MGGTTELRALRMEGVRVLGLILLLAWWGGSNIRGMAAPTGPDFETCLVPHVMYVETPYNCCAPAYSKPPLLFDLQSASDGRPLRQRKAAHTIDEETKEKLNRAYELMRQLPDDDPRSFLQQSKIHCSYCNLVHRQANANATSDIEMLYQVHGSWLFFPFHRWHLYFHERILAKLVGDPDLSIPFWQWDSMDGAAMPEIYVDEENYPALFDRNREASHLPPHPMAFDILLDIALPNRTFQEQIQINNKLLFQVMVNLTNDPYLFYGQPFRAGDEPAKLTDHSIFESIPHGAVHAWVGDSKNLYHDMGVFDLSARDPIFHAHHSNIDRLWEVWKTFNYGTINESDFLDSYFLFYNENAELVQVTVRDSFTTEILGYTYEDVQNEWLHTNISSHSCRKNKEIDSNGFSYKKCSLGDSYITSTCSVLIDANKIGLNDGAIIYMIISNIEVQVDALSRFEVFINFPEANESTPLNCNEHLGSFLHVPRIPLEGLKNVSMKYMQLSIDNSVQELDMWNGGSLIVTIVPSIHPSIVPVKIGSVTLESKKYFF